MKKNYQIILNKSCLNLFMNIRRSGKIVLEIIHDLKTSIKTGWIRIFILLDKPNVEALFLQEDQKQNLKIVVIGQNDEKHWI